MEANEWIIGPDDRVLVTGATGFIGVRVVKNLLERGFRNLCCFTRTSSNCAPLEAVVSSWRQTARVDIITGNLLSREDCRMASKGASVIYHLAAGTGIKSVPDAFLNTVVCTRNLADAAMAHGTLKRFVTISSFAVYTNQDKPHGDVLDESCPVKSASSVRDDAYCFAKIKQDEIIMEYGDRHRLPFVIIRPGVVYGSGKTAITGRVGLDTFGIFLHLGGSNRIPFTYVDNCADAIVLAGLVKGVDGEVFNVVDDDLPTSRRFLRLYKHEVKHFRSIPMPRPFSYLFCYLWEKYSEWSRGQLPQAFNRLAWHSYWKGNIPVNGKIKSRLGWRQRVPTADGLKVMFASRRENT